MITLFQFNKKLRKEQSKLFEAISLSGRVQSKDCHLHALFCDLLLLEHAKTGYTLVIFFLIKESAYDAINGDYIFIFDELEIYNQSPSLPIPYEYISFHGCKCSNMKIRMKLLELGKGCNFISMKLISDLMPLLLQIDQHTQPIFHTKRGLWTNAKP